MKDIEPSRELQRMYAAMRGHLDRIKKLEAALLEIANSEFCSLENPNRDEWFLGVEYGHRRCANIALKALADMHERYSD